MIKGSIDFVQLNYGSRDRRGGHKQRESLFVCGDRASDESDHDSLPDLDELLKTETKPTLASKVSDPPATRTKIPSDGSIMAPKSRGIVPTPRTTDPSSLQTCYSKVMSSPDSNKAKRSGIMSMAPKYKKRVKTTPATDRTELSSQATIDPPTTGSISACHLSAPPLATRVVPDWYSTTSSTDPRLRSDSITLRRLKTLHQTYQSALNNTVPFSQLHAAESSLCAFIHSLSLFDLHGAEKAVIRKSFLLTDPDIFPPLLADSPPYIYHPAQHLYKRWWKGDTDPNLLRGVIRTRSKSSRTGHAQLHYALDPGYEFRVSARYVGQGELYVGQWWPLQICANRDGAHGEIEAGVYGVRGMGALSVVLSGGGYADIDQGDVVYYCGTPSPTSCPPSFSKGKALVSMSSKKVEPSFSTALLQESQAKGQDIRVLRSSKSPEKKWAPVRGIRYDGLYTITGSMLVEPATCLWRFKLVRKEGQEGICCAGGGRGVLAGGNGGGGQGSGGGGGLYQRGAGKEGGASSGEDLGKEEGELKEDGEIGADAAAEVLEDLRIRPHPIEIEALKRDERVRKYLVGD